MNRLELSRRLALSAALALSACGPAAPEPVAPAVAAAPSASAAPPAPAASAPPPDKPATAYRGHGAETLPPEVLEKYKPGALPPEVTRRVQAMLDVRAPGAGVLSPDGRALFYTWTITGTRQVFRLDGPQRFPAQLTGGEDATTVVDVMPSGKEILVARDRRGEEYPGLYLQHVRGGALTVIQHKPKVQTLLQHVSSDGRYVYYRANDLKADSYAIYRYDLTLSQPRGELLFDREGLWALADVRDDEKLLLAKEVGGNMAEYFEYDLEKKELTPLFGQGEREDYVALYGAADGEVLVQTPKIGEFRRLYAWKAGKLEPVVPERKADVVAFSIDKKRRRVLYQTNDGGYTRLYAFDAKTHKDIEVPSFPGADHVLAGATTPDGRYTTISVETATSPAVSYVYDWQSKKLAQWHSPAAPEIDTSRFARAALEEYPARDGTKIPMFVRRPSSCAEPCPVVVAFHGGPEGQARPGFNARAQLFIDAGFVYVEPNVRGSDGYGKTWIHADDGAKRLAVATDIEDAAAYIRKAWAKDGKAPKIAAFGGSYGGYSVLLAMTRFAGAYDAGVSVVGISSLLTFLENTAPYRRALRISEYGDPVKDREALTELSPITHVDKVSAPLLLIQGATDPRVPAGEALQMFEAIQRKNVPSGFILFADEGHGMQKRENQVLAYGHLLQFLEKHLKGR
jgi:dipeptidyl aminopeptidase/acylaminoacyl peptidase